MNNKMIAVNILWAWIIFIFLVSVSGKFNMSETNLLDPNFYLCFPGMASVGVITPAGDKYKLKGEEPFSIYCHINPLNSSKYTYYHQGYNSSHLSFYIGGDDGEPDEILMETRRVNSTIVNATTIQHMFHPNTAGVFKVKCSLRIKRKKIISGNKISQNVRKTTENGRLSDYKNIGVCYQQIHVGYLPQNVTNFSCVSENWENLNCTWDETYNPIPTTYDVHFKASGRMSPYQQCPDKKELEKLLMKKIPKNQNICYLNQKTHPPYRDSVQRMFFFFNATNIVQPNGSIHHYEIQHTAVVRPGQPQSLTVVPDGEASLKIKYEVPIQLRSFPPGLIQSVRYKSQWSEDWFDMDIKEHIGPWRVAGQMPPVVLNLTDLEFAWTNYTVAIKLLSQSADRTDSSYWSNLTIANGQTLPMLPPPPTIHPASFEVVEGSEDRKIIVYWRQINRTRHNGPNFTYEVSDVKMSGKSEPIVASDIMSAYATFEGVRLSNYTFSIASRNAVGSSLRSSTIFVNKPEFLVGIQPRSFTNVQLKDGNFEVAWQPPEDKHLVTHYTIFWCKYHLPRPYKCDGQLFWTDVQNLPTENKAVTNGTFVVQQIKFPDQGNYQMAIAANTLHYSSGMVWATCTIIKDKFIGKVTDISLDFVTENSLLLRWRLDCADRGGIVIQYQVEYCPLADINNDFDCSIDMVVNNVTLDQEEIWIRNLTPWTYYKIGVRVITRGGPGELSVPLINQTKPATPGSEPLNLKVINIKDSQAELGWISPAIPNGKVDYYQVTFSPANKDKNHQISQTVNVNVTTFAMEGLMAYTMYEVNISACNFLFNGQPGCSKFHAMKRFQTLAGKPGQANKPRVIFINTTLVEVKWDTDFQLGAEVVEDWEIKVGRSGKAWENDPREHSLLVPGNLSNHTLDLLSIQEDADWSPDCEDKNKTNLFSFKIRAVVKDLHSKKVGGEWSEQVILPAYCKARTSWGLLISVSIILPIVVVLLLLAICRGWNWFQRKKEFFSKIADGLDNEIVVASISGLDEGTMMKEFVPSNNRGKIEKKSSYSRKESKGSMETLLHQIGKSHHESGRSDTTSGCESGQSNDQGEDGFGGDNRNSSNAVQEKVENVEQECQIIQEPGSFLAEAEEYVPNQKLTESNCLGYSKVAACYTNSGPDTFSSPGSHPEKLSSPTDLQNINKINGLIGYVSVSPPDSNVGNLSSTTESQINIQNNGHTCHVAVPSSASDSGKLSDSTGLPNNNQMNGQAGYVAVASVKLPPMSGPGYITVNQVNNNSFQTHPSIEQPDYNNVLAQTEAQCNNTKTKIISSPSQGYSRIGIMPPPPTSNGYISNSPMLIKPSSGNRSTDLLSSLTSNPSLEQNTTLTQLSFKPSSGYVQPPPLSLAFKGDKVMSKPSDILLKTPDTDSPYKQVVASRLDTAPVSMV